MFMTYCWVSVEVLCVLVFVLLLLSVRCVSCLSSPWWAENRLSSTETRAHFMASLIWFLLTGSRYWSYRVAIGLPVLSVTVVTSGGGMSARSEDVFSTVSLAWLDMTTAAPATGK